MGVSGSYVIVSVSLFEVCENVIKEIYLPCTIGSINRNAKKVYLLLHPFLSIFLLNLGKVPSRLLLLNCLNPL